ncbi:17.8 kDa class I heat shock protein [Acorus calamus]|uniref:17.8 kDa class I heat shock protein n=1 Tax=Acorus calamus TaxID=4465 RepID=A0AAV9CFP3_ACOCL|nr:17.8 kDa class I heat shock protein [Acorus calamus]
MVSTGPVTRIAPSYEDFEPRFERRQEETSDTLVFQLPGFKKEQLKVQIDNYGNIKVSGERPLEDNGGGPRRSRFRKELKIPDNCNVSDIRARFDNEVLYIVLPKLITTTAATDPQPPLPDQTTPKASPEEPKPIAEEAKQVAEKEKEKERETVPEETAMAGGDRVPDDVKGGGGVLMGMKRRPRRALVNVVVAAVVAVVGVVIYVTWKMRSRGVESTSLMHLGNN